MMSAKFLFSFMAAVAFATPTYADLDSIQSYWDTIPASLTPIDPQFTRSFAPDEYAYLHCPEVNTPCYFMAENGDAISARIFEKMNPYNGDGLATVRVNGKWGYLDRSGNWVLPPEYDYVSSYQRQGRYTVRKNELYGALDAKGNWIFQPRSATEVDFHNGVASVEIGGKIGFIDLAGKMVIPPTFMPGTAQYTGPHSYEFNEYGYALAGRASTEYYFGMAWGLIDRFGNWVIQPNYYSIGRMLPNGNVLASLGDFDHRLWGILDLNETWVVAPENKGIGVRVFSGDGLFGNKSGVLLGRDEYLTIADYNGLITVTDQNGNPLLPEPFQYLGGFDDQGYAVARMDGRWGFVDPNGEWIFQVGQLRRLSSFSENNLASALDDETGLEGFIDRTGAWHLPPTYVSASGFNKFGLARIDELDDDGHEYRGFINATGDLVIPMTRQRDRLYLGFYDTHGFLVVGEDWDKKGLVDTNGDWVLPPIFSSIEVIENLFSVEMVEFKYAGYLTMDGTPVGAFADVLDRALAESDAIIALNAECDQGNAGACMSFYRALLQTIPIGSSITVRGRRAMEALDRACKSSAAKTDPQMCLVYGQHLYTGDITGFHGTTIDDQQFLALAQFNGACRAGSSVACLYSVDGLRRGIGRLADFDAENLGRHILSRLERACDLDSARGCHELGTFHEGNEYPQADHAASQPAFTRACMLAPDEYC